MNRVPPDRLLSVSPYFYKKVFPVLWLVVTAVIAISILIGDRGPSGFGTIAFLVAVFGIGYVIMRTIAGGLADSVRDGGDHLVGRIGGREESVLLQEIESVKESSYAKQPPRLELVLKYPGNFGRVIAFIPVGATMVYFVPFTKSELFHELEERVRIAHAEHRTAEQKTSKD